MGGPAHPVSLPAKTAFCVNHDASITESFSPGFTSSKPPDSTKRASPLITNLPIPSSPSVAPVSEEDLASPDLTDFKLVANRKS
ncbi:hypothetical protein AVEN_38374-1 [Araneus ventricosus]|uniref:Uncharacterized protein n=1 Tax=Araneus ventricosus TaxID=182803 RepID=A0A4Y2M5Q4_ARAVE|nr:hypothetical protein AVEN_38374-1 [Araneus ventricosus]